MTDSPRLEIELVLDDGTVKKGFAKIEKDADKVAKKAEKSFISFNTILAGTAVAMSAVFATRKFIDAANEQEDAVNSLNSALTATGKFSKQTSKELQEYASSLQQTSRFGDEAILANQALIQNLGRLDKESLKGATSAALDLATALRVDLGTASNLIGRAATGNIALFSRYGLVIEKGADNNETFANTLRTINEQFGGAAQRDLNTYKGASEQLDNAIGDLNEEIGFLFTKSNGARESVNDLRKGVESLIEIVKRDGPEAFAVLSNLGDLLLIEPSKFMLNLLSGGNADGQNKYARALGTVNQELEKQKEILRGYEAQLSSNASSGDSFVDAFTSVENSVMSLFGVDTGDALQSNIDTTKAKIIELEQELLKIQQRNVQFNIDNTGDDEVFGPELPINQNCFT